MPSQMDLRTAARERGEKYYSTNEPCRRGHVATRYVSNGGCLQCLTGKAPKDLTRVQAVIMRRWIFHTVIATQLGPEVEAALEAYLTRCMDAFHTARGAVFPVNYLSEKIAFVERTGRRIGEYKPGM